MAYMFGNVDEDDALATPVDASVTTESTQLRQGAIVVFGGSACLLPWLAPVAVFGMMASGALILATWPAAECQVQVNTEIKRSRFGCAWIWWVVMAAIVVGLAYIGMAGGALAYMEMRGIQ